MLRKKNAIGSYTTIGRKQARTRKVLSIESLENRIVMMAADLLTPDVDLLTAGSLDAPLRVMTTVENVGQAASGRYSVQYHLSLDSTIDARDRVIFTTIRPELNAGETDEWTQTITIPAGVPQGSFYVGVTIDHQNRIMESNEANNVVVTSESINLLKGLPPSDCASFGSSSTEFVAGANCRVINIDGYQRTYVAYLPENIIDSSESVPLVTMFHGGSGNGGQFLNISGWQQKADEEGFIAVFPTAAMYCKSGDPCENGRLSGWTTKWNSHDFEDAPDINFDIRPPAYPNEAPWPADDVGFVGQMLDHLESSLPIDTDRIYGSGFSSGAGFTRRLMFDMPERLAAVAYVGGGFNSARDPVGTRKDPIPVFCVLGSKDPKLLASFGLSPDDEFPLAPNELRSVMGETFFIDTLDALQLEYDPNDLRADRVLTDSISTQLSWARPKPGNETGNSFHFAVWSGLTHHYPFVASPDKNPNGFVAVDTFWDFFQRYEKPDEEPVPGDVTGDGIFNSSDLIAFFVAGEYEDGITGNSTREEGDWNGDSEFDSSDLVYLFSEGSYVNAALRERRPEPAQVFDDSREDEFPKRKTHTIREGVLVDEIDRIFGI